MWKRHISADAVLSVQSIADVGLVFREKIEGFPRLLFIDVPVRDCLFIPFFMALANLCIIVKDKSFLLVIVRLLMTEQKLRKLLMTFIERNKK